MSITFALTLQTMTEVPVAGVAYFLLSSPRAPEVFRNRQEVASWILERITRGYYGHSLLVIHHLEDIGKYDASDISFIFKTILSHAGLSANIQLLINQSFRARAFLTTVDGLKLIYEHYPTHRWLFEIYEQNKHLTPQDLVTYTSIVNVIKAYNVPGDKCVPLLKEILATTTRAASTAATASEKQCIVETHSELWRTIVVYYIEHCTPTREELEICCEKLKKSVFWMALKDDICRARANWLPPPTPTTWEALLLKK